VVEIEVRDDDEVRLGALSLESRGQLVARSGPDLNKGARARVNQDRPTVAAQEQSVRRRLNRARQNTFGSQVCARQRQCPRLEQRHGPSIRFQESGHMTTIRPD
jgi:hypothetical protein